MTKLTREALHTLQDDAAPFGVQSVAVSTLLAAFEHELQVPNEAPLAVWRWLARTGGNAIALLRVNVIPGDEVVREAVMTLKSANVGDEVEDLAITILERASNLSSITDADVTAIMDGEPGPGRSRRLIWFLEAVHEHSGVSSAVLVALRDRWASSEKHYLREASIGVATLLSGLDEAYLARLLADSSPRVRSAVAGLLGATDGQDGHVAERLLKARMVVEEHRQVRSDLHLALGSLAGP